MLRCSLHTRHCLRANYHIFNRQHSTIPFDTQPFPFSRFQPCCPDEASPVNDNGFVPCQQHPVPHVLGRKIEMTEPMTNKLESYHHLVGCVGDYAPEWNRAKVESVPGIVQSIMTAENHWIKERRQKNLSTDVLNNLLTLTDKPSINQYPDIMLFPEFKMFTSIDPSFPLDNTSFYSVLDTLWSSPHNISQSNMSSADIQADTVVLVCNHARRDMRCGKIGPLIINEFRRVIKEKGLNNRVEVWGTSHFGGK
ncbi:Sucrase/ferredoxin-like-domain-containing protein [Pilobolus umbonatus]|nr:Sucrase/ferredoxin-like-domain-containing protein [Pilobolus umbonatus]